MDTWSFWGGFAAVALFLGIGYALLQRKVQRLWRSLFGGLGVHAVVEELNRQEPGPRSLNGCDRLLLPRILEDFPDYDVNGAKNAVRDYLRRQLGNHSQLQIHKVVIARYLPTGMQKTVVFQAAVGWKEQGQTVQKRYDLHHCYSPDTATAAVAANCPNCGANLGYGVVECPYCGSRVGNVMKNTWEFTQMLES